MHTLYSWIVLPVKNWVDHGLTISYRLQLTYLLVISVIWFGFIVSAYNPELILLLKRSITLYWVQSFQQMYTIYLYSNCILTQHDHCYLHLTLTLFMLQHFSLYRCYIEILQVYSKPHYISSVAYCKGLALLWGSTKHLVKD